jgi:hypothetical protein
MSGRIIKPATITNIASETDIGNLTNMVNAWLDEEGLPLKSWDEIEADEPYQAEILRVAIRKWDELATNDSVNAA